MDKEYYKKKILEIRLKIAYLPFEERENKDHPYYKELKDVKKRYARSLFEERWKEEEKKEYDKHKRR